MTIAACFSCGELKSTAFMCCSHCNRTPTNEEEMLVSLALTGHHLDIDSLLGVGKAIRAGSWLKLNEKTKQDLMQELRLLKNRAINNF